MTSTIEAPTTITAPAPCPAWCPDAGNHSWSVDEHPNPDGTYNGSRFHRLVTCDLPRTIVACEKFETTYDGPFSSVVEITDGSAGSIELSNPERVAEFVAAVQDAAAVAFLADPEIKVRLAEQAVLQAVADWCRGFGTVGAIREAHDALATARCDLDATR